MPTRIQLFQRMTFIQNITVEGVYCEIIGYHPTGGKEWSSCESFSVQVNGHRLVGSFDEMPTAKEVRGLLKAKENNLVYRMALLTKEYLRNKKLDLLYEWIQKKEISQAEFQALLQGQLPPPKGGGL